MVNILDACKAGGGELAEAVNNIFATITNGFIDASIGRLMHIRLHRRYGVRDLLLNHG